MCTMIASSFITIFFLSLFLIFFVTCASNKGRDEEERRERNKESEKRKIGEERKERKENVDKMRRRKRGKR